MAKKKKKKGVAVAKPGATVTRKVTSGRDKGDTVQFKANAPGTQEPGKLKPRRVIRDVPPLRKKSSTIPKGKKKKTAKKKSR